ncbi:MAG: EFR1 family ferrodoxin [Candidatus Bipolaricaulaceae bacterium]
MHRTTVFYFSGTGNSLAVARGLAGRLAADLLPVARFGGGEKVYLSAEAIGMAFPVYDFRPPALMESFVRRFVVREAKYLFAVATYGIGVGHSLSHLEKAVRSVGGKLAGGFGVPMPHNGIGCGHLTERHKARLLQASAARVESISQYVASRRSGSVEARTPALSLLRPTALRMTPSVMKLLAHVAFGGMGSLAFRTDDACTACGTCVRICPTGNIELTDGRPKWGDRCAGCFACLHWCPAQAICLGGHHLDITPYHHPDVTLEDMLAQPPGAGP